MNNLTNIINSRTIQPHRPWGLTTASPSTLIFADTSTSPRYLRWFDCNEMKLNDKSIQLTQYFIADITFAQDGDKELLTSAHYEEGIFSFNTRTGQLEWSVKGKLPGMEEDLYAHSITSDDHGNLFVSDFANSCMQMLSVSDGRYLGCLFREGEHGLGRPWCADWCEEISSLIVVDANKWISKVELAYNNWVNVNL